MTNYYETVKQTKIKKSNIFMKQTAVLSDIEENLKG